MRFAIHSCLLIDGQFVPIEAVDRSPRDPKYLNGAIVWTIQRKPILSERHWDLIDQLWAYLVQGLADFAEHGAFETGFPDQPLRFACRRLGGGKAEIWVGTERHVVDERDLLDSIAVGGEAFFGWATQSVLGGSTYQKYLQIITRWRSGHRSS